MWKRLQKHSSSINLKFIIFCSCVLIFVSLVSVEIFCDKEDLSIYRVVSINDYSGNEVQNSYVEDLKKVYNNDDIVGAISIPGTGINEAVLQTNDNSYYLNHDEYKNYDSYGSIFMDYRINLNSSNKILIYGHNSSYVYTPFGELEGYYDENFYNKHKYITLETQSEIRTYEIFSVYIETSDFDYMNLNFYSDKEWGSHLIKLKNNSLYDTGVELDDLSMEEILIIQTCSTHKDYKNYDKKYLLVVAKRI